jgi:hypothetical protein
MDGKYNSNDIQMLLISSKWQPQSVLKILNAKTKHSGHFGGKLLYIH